MNANQIHRYEYCDEYIKHINQWKSKIPFGVQHHGCGSQSPNIEHELERIHRDMYEKVIRAIIDAEKKTKKIIENI